MDIYFILLYFFVYGFLGWCTEVGYAAFKEHRFVNRGFLNGPICPIYGVGVTVVTATLAPMKGNFLLLYISSFFLVSLLEGLTGWAMDKIFHNKWWEYSRQPLNIGGYVCLLFSLIWGAACVLIMEFIHPMIQKLLALLPHTFGVILLVVFSIAMFADLYVTASAIFRFNKRLASMQKIAAELHEISDQLGEEIYQRVVSAIEVQEASRKKLDEAASGLREKTQETTAELRTKTQEVSEEISAHISELKNKYQELGTTIPLITRRLVHAFPKMESRHYKLLLDDLRIKLNEKFKK